MCVAIKQEYYPHIGSDPNIAKGAPLIEGTRITVRCIAGYYQMGISIDEILSSLSHITPAQIHAAIAFYFDHQEEIDAEIDEASDENYWKTQVIQR